jgi:2-succinyl-5-enolpyruvyl-6-hydroxy-3-cyclohexene-1-carboxylate synthase
MTSVPRDIATWNWNLFAASLMVRTWKKLGIRHYFVSPGYRDAPLIAALQSEMDLTIVSGFDERAAAYQALGFAKVTGRPGVLICTSGTAGANYLPAVIEASVDQIPMIIVTADRPFELVHAAAQQVIDQRGLFGHFVRKHVDFPAPGPDLQARAWVSYARELLVTTCSYPAGPVHINLPLKMPLDPVVSSHRPGPEHEQMFAQAIERLPAQWWPREAPEAPKEALASLAADLRSAERGLLVAGRLTQPWERDAVSSIQKRLGWPIYCDIGSGLKGHCATEVTDLQIPRMQQWLETYRPDCVLHFGRRLVTRHIDEVLLHHPPPSYWVLSRETGVQDPSHVAGRQQLAVDLAKAAAWDVWQEGSPSPSLQIKELAGWREKFEKETELFGFAAVAQAILRQTPARSHGLFLGNSTAIRAFDHWCLLSRDGPRMEANRGVSGIEGLLATTLGLVQGSGHGWTAVLGDVSLMHDLNSLLSLAQQNLFVIVVVVNNAGGRIFETLPIAEHAWVKDPLITTPHSFQFEGISDMAGLPYAPCRTLQEFETAYARALRMKRPAVIECIQAPNVDLEYQKRLKERGAIDVGT